MNNTRPQQNYFTPFKTSVDSIALPQKFTFPFYYEPHALCLQAAAELQQHMETQTEWEWDFNNTRGLEGICMGKMFGVLVVKNQQGQLGYLSAFSGKLADTNHLPGFVPPVYDMLASDGFYLTDMDELNELNEQIKQIEASGQLADYRSLYQSIKASKDKELTVFKQTMKNAKRERAKQREAAQHNLTEQDYTELDKKLIQESLKWKRDLKTLVEDWNRQEQQAKEKLEAIVQGLEGLKQERKAKSAALQQKLFNQYRFLNILGEQKNLVEIFETTEQKRPPAAAGECCAPKLLQYAFLHNLQPVAMAEFWWGQSPKGEIRKHGNFYPACRGKCEPILGHMLQGLEMDENPMLKSPELKKEIELVYDDEDLAVINKPAEFLSVPGKNSSDSVVQQMRKRFPNATGPLVVHRLDMSTSGLMLITKNMATHKHLQSQFIKRKIHKTYLAVLEGLVEGNKGVINLPLRVDLNDRPRQMVCYEHGKAACTKWEVVKREANRTYIKFSPLTGRTHQLRVHAAHPLGLNTPIVGDDLYGTKANRLHLHAYSITFRHPQSNEMMTVEVKADFW